MLARALLISAALCCVVLAQCPSSASLGVKTTHLSQLHVGDRGSVTLALTVQPSDNIPNLRLAVAVHGAVLTDWTLPGFSFVGTEVDVLIAPGQGGTVLTLTATFLVADVLANIGGPFTMAMSAVCQGAEVWRSAVLSGAIVEPLRISVQTDPPEADAGDLVSFFISVSNDSPVDAVKAVSIVLLPHPFISFLPGSVVAARGLQAVAIPVTPQQTIFDVGSLAPGEFATLRYSVLLLNTTEPGVAINDLVQLTYQARLAGQFCIYNTTDLGGLPLVTRALRGEFRSPQFSLAYDRAEPGLTLGESASVTFTVPIPEGETHNLTLVITADSPDLRVSSISQPMFGSALHASATAPIITPLTVSRRRWADGRLRRASDDNATVGWTVSVGHVVNPPDNTSDGKDWLTLVFSVMLRPTSMQFSGTFLYARVNMTAGSLVGWKSNTTQRFALQVLLPSVEVDVQPFVSTANVLLFTVFAARSSVYGPAALSIAADTVVSATNVAYNHISVEANTTWAVLLSDNGSVVLQRVRATFLHAKPGDQMCLTAVVTFGGPLTSRIFEQSASGCVERIVLYETHTGHSQAIFTGVAVVVGLVCGFFGHLGLNWCAGWRRRGGAAASSRPPILTELALLCWGCCWARSRTAKRESMAATTENSNGAAVVGAQGQQILRRPDTPAVQSSNGTVGANDRLDFSSLWAASTSARPPMVAPAFFTVAEDSTREVACATTDLAVPVASVGTETDMAPHDGGLNAAELQRHRAFAKEMVEGQVGLSEAEQDDLLRRHEAGLARLQAALLLARDDQAKKLRRELAVRQSRHETLLSNHDDMLAAMEAEHFERKEQFTRALQDEYARLIAQLQYQRARDLVDIRANHEELQSRMVAELAARPGGAAGQPVANVEDMLVKHVGGLDRLSVARDNARRDSAQKLQQRLATRHGATVVDAAAPAAPAAKTGIPPANAARGNWLIALQGVGRARQHRISQWQHAVDSAVAAEKLRTDLATFYTRARTELLEGLLDDLSHELQLAPEAVTRVSTDLFL